MDNKSGRKRMTFDRSYNIFFRTTTIHLYNLILINFYFLMKKISTIFCIFALVSACTPPQYIGEKSLGNSEKMNQTNAKRPKNIILMIGDGMGLAQVTAGMYMNNNHLSLEQFTTIGLHKNYPDDEEDGLITDSAAGATSFACGVKTYNAAIGVGVDSLPRTTILELAESHGLATGLVATCNIQHATPASFIAHCKNRALFEDIALDFLKTDIDLFIGGGKKPFDDRKDGRNLLTEFKNKGYYINDWTQAELDTVTFPNQNVGFLTANLQPLMATQGRNYLPVASQKACDFLKMRSDKGANKGFFAMIEGSQIDWGGHAGDPDYIVGEMLDFNKAIEKVLDFAKKDGNTLVIVTADHETGGFAVLKGSKMGKIIGGFAAPYEEKTKSRYHTGSLIPVYAFGPGAEAFGGIYENTAIFDKMKMLFGF
jgi:alkaline phosphatase